MAGRAAGNEVREIGDQAQPRGRAIEMRVKTDLPAEATSSVRPAPVVEMPEMPSRSPRRGAPGEAEFVFLGRAGAMEWACQNGAFGMALLGETHDWILGTTTRDRHRPGGERHGGPVTR